MPGNGKRITTRNTNNGHEVIGVDVDPKDFDKLNMDGASPVKVVKHNSIHK